MDIQHLIHTALVAVPNVTLDSNTDAEGLRYTVPFTATVFEGKQRAYLDLRDVHLDFPKGFNVKEISDVNNVEQDYGLHGVMTMYVTALKEDFEEQDEVQDDQDNDEMYCMALAVRKLPVEKRESFIAAANLLLKGLNS